ncbi:MAG: type II toxin-antitoxin system CcdA family antitoxin [Rhodospirillales bacterium]|nr:type II toxin-antitoxin system CcdA family antitoxin [Rhodospirillales bacterium]
MNELAPQLSPVGARGRKRAVNLTLSESLVREARALTPNLSETVETLLAAHVAAETRRRAEREQAIDATIAFANAHFDEHGVIGADYAPT